MRMDEAGFSGHAGRAGEAATYLGSGRCAEGNAAADGRGSGGRVAGGDGRGDKIEGERREVGNTKSSKGEQYRDA
jgi:hypothetical protein